MLYHEQSEDYRPLFWMSGRPIYVNTLILCLHVLAFALTGLAMAALNFDVISALTLNNYEIIHSAHIWRLFSYVIFPPATAECSRAIFSWCATAAGLEDSRAA